MRHRETKIGDAFGFDATSYVHPPGGSSGVWAVTKYGTESLKFIDDVEIDGFRKLLKCGKFLPLNPVVIQTAVLNRNPGPVSAYLSASDTSWSGSYCSPPVFDASSMLKPLNQDFIDSAILSAASNAANGGWDVLTFAAELRSSADTLYSVSRGFSQAVLRAAHVARDFRRNPWQRFRELWLLGRYGIRPMVYDVIDAYEAFHQLVKGPQDMITGRGWLAEELDREFNSGWVDDGPDYERRDMWKLTGFRKYRGVAYVRPSKLEAVGFDLDWPTTAWELIPYSFVIDRFINIGNWVSTLTPRLSGAYEGIGSSIQESYTFESSRMWNVKAGRGSGTWSGGECQLKIERYVRGPASIPFPPLLPRVDWMFALDLLALFVGTDKKVKTILNRR